MSVPTVGGVPPRPSQGLQRGPRSLPLLRRAEGTWPTPLALCSGSRGPNPLLLADSQVRQRSLSVQPKCLCPPTPRAAPKSPRPLSFPCKRFLCVPHSRGRHLPRGSGRTRPSTVNKSQMLQLGVPGQHPHPSASPKRQAECAGRSFPSQHSPCRAVFRESPALTPHRPPRPQGGGQVPSSFPLSPRYF